MNLNYNPCKIKFSSSSSLSLSLSLSPSISVSVSLGLCSSVPVSVSLSLSSVCLSVCLFFHTFPFRLLSVSIFTAHSNRQPLSFSLSLPPPPHSPLLAPPQPPPPPPPLRYSAPPLCLCVPRRRFSPSFNHPVILQEEA